MNTKKFEWEDESKVAKHKASFFGYTIIQIIVLVLFVLLVTIEAENIDSALQNLTIPPVLAFEIIIMILIIGPVIMLAYRIKRDGQASRLAYDKDRFLMISEKDGTILEEFLLSKIKAIFLDNVEFGLFITRTEEERKKLNTIYSETNETYNRTMGVGDVAALGGLFRSTPTLAGGAYTMAQIQIFKVYPRLRQVSPGLRIVNVKGLRNLLDELGFSKENMKGYVGDWVTVYTRK